MRKIEKDLADIPQSLVVNEGQLTHARRKELIKKGGYIDSETYNSRYKLPDIKDKLENLYHHKCAYCENKVEQGHVEHYRPKKLYPWLAYSWDNLIYGCPTCNQFKGIHFDIDGKRATPPKIADDLSEINTWSSQRYDKLEKPMFLNPERDDLKDVFLFDRQGHIRGNNNPRADYTIEKCHLDRDFLVDERRKIINDFRNLVNAEYLKPNTKDVQKERLSVLVGSFVESSKDETNTFTAYRNAAVAWLDEIVKDLFKKNI